MEKTKKSKAERLHNVIIAPFATPAETAKILKVSLKRLKQLEKLVNRAKS